MITRSVSVAVTPLFTWSTPTALPPLIVTPAAGPTIAMGVAVFDSTRLPSAGDRVIVCEDENIPLEVDRVGRGGRHGQVAGLALVLTLAQLTAVRRRAQVVRVGARGDQVFRAGLEGADVHPRAGVGIARVAGVAAEGTPLVDGSTP